MAWHALTKLHMKSIAHYTKNSVYESRPGMDCFRKTGYHCMWCPGHYFSIAFGLLLLVCRSRG